MLCNMLVNSGDEKRWTELCCIWFLKVDLRGFGDGLNVGNEEQCWLPASCLFWDLSQSLGV